MQTFLLETSGILKDKNSQASGDSITFVVRAEKSTY